MQSVDTVFTTHSPKEIFMKKHLLLSLAILSGLSMTALPVLADGSRHAPPRDPGVNHRQHNQNHRIHQGVRSGELTRAEAHDLRQDRRAIRAEEREYKSDGKLTQAERRDLHQDMNKLSRDIHSQKHDGDQRPRAH